MLHTVNKSPFEKDSLTTCLRLSSAGANILLIEDGVYGALAGSQYADGLVHAMGDRNIYVLGPDLSARGISEDKIIDGISVVDYAGFVELAATSAKVQSWL